jgi:hypothetical protein
MTSAGVAGQLSQSTVHSPQVQYIQVIVSQVLLLSIITNQLQTAKGSNMVLQ